MDVRGRGVTTVELDYPVEAFGEEVRRLTFRRPTLGDMVKCDGLGRMAMVAKLIELCADIPASAVRAIDASDLDKLAEVVAGFTGSSEDGGS